MKAIARLFPTIGGAVSKRALSTSLGVAFVLAAWAAINPLRSRLGWGLDAALADTVPREAEVTDSARPNPTINPHWSADYCFECHNADQGPEPVRIESSRVDAACLRCHDGSKAVMEKHPIGRPARTPFATVPPGWPAHDDRIGCLTCHDAMLAGEHSEKTRGANSSFLRGTVHSRTTAFCAQCHTAPEYGQFNPHLGSGPRQSGPVERIEFDRAGHISASDCRFCHVADMPRDALVRSGSADLLADEITLCASCHPNHIDFFEPGHIGATMPVDMIARLSEKRGWSDAGAGDRSDSASKVLEQLPLGPDNRVVCSTCHNPHPAGLFPEGSILAMGALELRPDDHVGTRARTGFSSLRIPSAAFCTECHFSSAEPMRDTRSLRDSTLQDEDRLRNFRGSRDDSEPRP